MCYSVYILYSAKHNKIYVGYTSNLLQRFKSHNELGKDWTKDFRPWTVIYVEYYREKKIAMQREKQLKQANNRAKIRKAIQEQFSTQYFITLS
jgi:putative endonuclease